MALSRLLAKTAARSAPCASSGLQCYARKQTFIVRVLQPERGRPFGHPLDRRRYLGAAALAALALILASTSLAIWSMEKLAGSWLGGYSMKVCRNSAAFNVI